MFSIVPDKKKKQYNVRTPCAVMHTVNVFATLQKEGRNPEHMTYMKKE
jgi:hypothetical protein